MLLHRYFNHVMMRHIARNREKTQRLWQQRISDTDELAQEDGSRNADGNVPYVYWNPDNRTVNVNWYDVRNANPRDGLRQKFQHNLTLLFGGVLCLRDKVFDPTVRHFGCLHNKD